MVYPIKFREQVFKIKKQEGLNNSEVAVRFGISKRVIYNWQKRIEPLLKRNKPATKINMEALKKDIDKHPDDYNYERAHRFNVSTSAIWYAIHRLGIRYKKNLSASKSRQRQTSTISIPNKAL